MVSSGMNSYGLKCGTPPQHYNKVFSTMTAEELICDEAGQHESSGSFSIFGIYLISNNI